MCTQEGFANPDDEEGGELPPDELPPGVEDYAYDEQEEY